MTRLALFSALTATAVVAWIAWPRQSRREKNMDDQARFQLLQTVANSGVELSVRLRALAGLVSNPGASTAFDLNNLLHRARPPQEPIKGWDPAGAERVVDWRLLAALHRLGYDSELGRVPVLVRQAGKVLVGPEDELHNAAEVILAIGRPELLAALIGLTSDHDPGVVRNAVRTLDQLKLPDPPVRQATSSVPGIGREVTFTITRLRQELEAIASYSGGLVMLSDGVRSPSVRDYERGEVRREGVPLSEIIENDLPELDFDYFVENGRVVICTYAEAGVRWQNWWRAYYPLLQYQPEKSLFVLRSNN